ncbi:MAG: sigma-54 dependent transcriptional regulator [Pirellulaceae bacterium]
MPLPKLLSIDDDRSVHHLVKRALHGTALEIVTAQTAEEGLARVRDELPDVILLDVMLPDLSGLEVCQKIKALDRRLPVIVATAAASSSVAIEAMKLGAFDYLPKPIDVTELRRLVDQALEARRLATVSVDISDLTLPAESGDAFVGRCPAMQNVFKAIGRVARQDIAVLIRGESGTGKELVARAIVQHGERSEAPFLAVNCAALSETLLESELFGHEKGAFTGAHDRRIGKFEQCDGGTIFMDEVGDMAPSVQSKLLRLLQQQTFERVGGNKTISVDVRVVSATNRDLEEMCESGEFRSDLYYRLNGYTIQLPPLRERGDDRVLLLQHFLAYWNKSLGRQCQGFSPDAMDVLLEYDWPGNVRELQSVVRQALLQSSAPVVLRSALPADLFATDEEPGGPAPSRVEKQAVTDAVVREVGGDDGVVYGEVAGIASDADQVTSPTQEELAPNNADVGGARGSGAVDGSDAWPSIEALIQMRLEQGAIDLHGELIEELERRLITQVLRHSDGNQSEAARLLGITRGSLRNKIRAYQISIDTAIRVAPAE